MKMILIVIIGLIIATPSWAFDTLLRDERTYINERKIEKDRSYNPYITKRDFDFENKYVKIETIPLYTTETKYPMPRQIENRDRYTTIIY